IQVFLRTSSEILGSCRTVFFRYIPNRRVLVAAQTQAFAGVDPGGVGVNFNETSPEFRSTDLRRPREVVEIGQMVEEIFHTADYIAYTVEALSEIQGVLLLLHAAPEASFSALLEEWVALLNKALSLLEAEKRMHVMAIKDAATDLLNRAHFITRLQQEISRARRTLLPVSLVMIAIDHYDQMIAKVGPEEAQVLLRMVARIFEKHSRVNDTIGRTGTDEFGIILPHTGKRGALIKAERLRRIVESADFSRVIRIFPHLTISLGVSEYPTMVRDAEELLQSADEALFQVRKNGNRTCVAKPPLEGFQPDFEVNEKGPS
ncbi:MAG: GGDEF domain-containing protein, partial [Bdellovibrionales bacterium]